MQKKVSLPDTEEQIDVAANSPDGRKTPSSSGSPKKAKN
jgi:hypothetical protein